MEIVWQFLGKMGDELPQDSVVTLMDIYSKDASPATKTLAQSCALLSFS